MGEDEPDGSDSYGDLIRWMLGLCWQHRGFFALTLAFQTLLALFAVMGLNLIGLGIDFLASRLQEGRGPPEWPLGWSPPAHWSPMETVAAIAAVAVLVALSHGLAQYGAARSTAELVHGRLTPGLQIRVFRKLQELCMRFYASNSSGSVINRATGDVQSVRSFVDLAMMEAVVLLITFVVYAAYMFRIHVGLTLACLSVAPLMAVGSAIFSQRTRPLFLKYREGFDKMILYLSETIRGAQLIKGFAAEDRAIGKMKDMNDEVWRRQQRIFSSISLFSPAVNMLSHLGMFILLLYGGRLVALGQLPLGTGLVVFAGLLQQYSNRISNVAQIANALQESLTGARRLREILGMESSLTLAADPKRPEPFRNEVVFEGASVEREEGQPVLRDINLVAHSGETIALVGETGSGKSALLGLIPRLYDPSSGCVRIGGVDARNYDLDFLRKRVGVVFQDSFLFNATVIDNIRFGREDASLEKVKRAARIARADEFIEELEQGYDSMVGEFGVDLSGGQRQRLSIARALLHDPPILLLDDPTSAIDPGTEREIMDAMERAMEGRTTFVVAHRLATLKRADKIAVLQGGRLCGFGTHEELARHNRIYADLVAAQSEDELHEEERSWGDRKAANL